MTIPERMTELEKKMSKLWDALEDVKRRTGVSARELIAKHGLDEPSGEQKVRNLEQNIPASGTVSDIHNPEPSESPSIFGTPQHLIPEGAVEFVSDGWYRALRLRPGFEVRVVRCDGWDFCSPDQLWDDEPIPPEQIGGATVHWTDKAAGWIHHWLSHFSEPMPRACNHHWVSGDNEVVSGSAVCLKCKTIVAADTVKLPEPMPRKKLTIKEARDVALESMREADEALAKECAEESELMPGAVEGGAKDGPTLPVSHRVTTEDGIQRELDWRDGKRMFRNLYRGEMDAQWECWKLGMDGCEVGDAWFEANKPDPAPKCTRCGDTGKVDVESMSRNGWSEPCPDCADEPNPSPSTAPLTDEGDETMDPLERLRCWGRYFQDGDPIEVGQCSLAQLVRDIETERARRDAEAEGLRAARNSLNDQLFNEETKIGQLVTRIADLEAKLKWEPHKKAMAEMAADAVQKRLCGLDCVVAGMTHAEAIHAVADYIADLEAQLKAAKESNEGLREELRDVQGYHAKEIEAREEVEAQLKVAKERAPDAEYGDLTEELKKGGNWLGAVRGWAQTNIHRGDELDWESLECVSVPFAHLWEMAERVAEETLREERQARARETLDIKDRWALEQKVERLEAQLVDVKETAETIRGFWNEEKAQAATARERFAGLRDGLVRAADFLEGGTNTMSNAEAVNLHLADLGKLLDAHPPLPEPGEGERVVLSIEEAQALSRWANEAKSPEGNSGWGPAFSAAMDVAKRVSLTIPEPVEPETTEAD